jgi:hypothetical protein
VHDKNSGARDEVHERVINVRKLVALDIVFHGYRFILLEFGLGVPAMIALGLFVLSRALIGGERPSVGGIALGAYVLSLALNYLPLLLHAIDLARKRSAHSEVERELEERGRAARRYGTQQLLLLVPLAVFVLAIVQAARGPSHPTKR